MVLTALQSLFGAKRKRSEQNNMDYLVIGLGNPGEKYERTRHNIGFLVLDAWNQNWKQKASLHGMYGEMRKSGNKLHLLKPNTFMNRSGLAAKAASQYFHIPTENIIVVHDDVDFPFGEIQYQFDRSSAGHNGIKSLIDELGTQGFHRIRIGIGTSPNPHVQTDEWVLGKWSKNEETALDDITSRAITGIENILSELNH